MRRSALRAAVTLGLFLLALAAGFVVSSQVGQRWMQEEVELQLGELLEGKVTIERVGLRFRTSLELHGVDVRVDYPEPGVGALSAKRVVAGLETTSLLLGRLRVATLEVDGLALHLRRNDAGEWSPPWFPAQAELDEKRKSDAGDLEHELGWMNVLIESTHFLMREQQIAHRIELTHSVVTLDDAEPRRGSKLDSHQRFENIQGRLERGWLDGGSDFNLTARWVSPDAPRAQLELSGRQREGEDAQLTIAFSDLELTSIRPYIVSPELGGEIAGRLAGVVALSSPALGHGRIELDWSVEGLKSQLPLGDTSLAFESASSTLRALLALEPSGLRIEEFRTQGPSIDFNLSGNIARPLAGASSTNLSATLRGTGLEDLQRVADGLPDSDAAPLRTLLSRLRSGRIPQVGMRGAAALRTWLEIASGELAALPPTIRLSANIEDVTFGTSETDTLSNVSGNLEWNGARFEMREFRGEFNGEALPRLDFTLDGLSTLLASAPESEHLTRRARALPGLNTLWELLRTDEDIDPEHPASPIRVTLDELHHPALRWPLRDAVFEIDPTNDRVSIAITHGHWAGAPVRGEAQLFTGAEERVSIPIRVADVVEDDAHRDSQPDYPDLDTEATWASGQFRTTNMHAGPLEFETLDAHFSLRGQELVLRSIDGQLAGGGTLSGEGLFSLAREEDIASQAAVRVRGAEADRVAQIFGIAEGIATGRADLDAELTANIRAETRIVDELIGRLELEARDGEIKQGVPLISAIAHALEGWSPFAASEALHYERIDAHIVFDHGQISTDRFALDGPLRLVASGNVNLDDEPDSIRGTLGVFLLRQAHQLLGNIPVVNLLIPGSDRGLIGAYFEIGGPLGDPSLTAMPIRSLTGGLPLPDALRQPFEALIDLFPGSMGGGTKTPKQTPKALSEETPIGEPSPKPAPEPEAALESDPEGATP